MTYKRRLIARRGIVVLAALAAVVLLVVKPFSGEPYRVTLIFEDASGLRPNGDVKVRGVRAGRIEEVELDREDRARVSARLFDDVGAVGAGARAQSRPTGPLGETYVDLQLGDPAQPLPSGATIAPPDTARYVGLDQALDVLDDPTRARLRILINEAGVGLAGRGSDLNRLLAALPPSLAESTELLGQIREENRELRSLIAAGDRVLAEVHPSRDQLGRLVGSAARTLEATASRRESLGAAVEEAPGALRQLRATLDQLGSTATALRPVARRLLDSAPPLARTLRALPSFERQARPALRSATRVSPTIESFARQTRPVLEELTPAGTSLASFGRSLRPVLDVLDAGGTAKFLRWLDGFGQIAERRDSLGNFIRLGLSLDTQVLEGAIDRYLGQRSNVKQRGRARRRGSADEQPAAAPDGAAAPGGDSPGAPSAGPEALPRDSVNHLLDFLLQP